MKKIILLLFVIFSSWQISAQVSSYTFSQGSGTYTPLTGGTVLASYTDAATGIGRMDDQTYNLPAATIPFTFTYDGIGYDGLNVNSNGFITFGATPPTGATYTPNSSTTAYAGSIAAFGRDLEGGFVFTADRTTGSPDLVNVSNLGPAQVGDFIDGTGIPAGTTILAIVGSTITMSANATTTGTLGPCRVGGTAVNIQYGVEGTAPNRVFVIQYSNFKRFGTTLTTVQHMSLNFQIRLSETTNTIDIVYGNCSPGLTTFTTVNQVGLRGPNNTFATNVNNRLNVKGTSDWATSIPGTLNTSGQVFNNVAPANVIASGLTYTWTPPVPCAGTPTPGTVAPAALSLCSGSLPGNLVASGYSSGVAGLTFQWEESTDGGGSWGNAVGGTNATTAVYTPPAYLGTPIQYRVKVTCSNSGLFDFSTSTVISNPTNPTTQVTNANITNPWSTAATVNWTNGNGSRRMVVVSDIPTFVDPTDGNAAALVANAVYSGTGQQIVYDGTAAAVTVTGLTPATNYYVKVYEYLRCGAGPYDYYYNVSTGTNVVTITTLSPPSNDLCSAAIPLTVGTNFAANPLNGSINGATTTAGLTPSCQAQFAFDVWYTVTVPSSGNLIIETQLAPTNSMTDSVLAVYSGACGTLTQVECDDDDGLGNMSITNTLTGRTPGEVLYVAVWKYATSVPAATATQFLISAYDCPSATPAPTGAAAQTFCGSATVADLVTTSGTDIKWYDAATLGNLLLSTDALVSGNIYYASQTTTPGCEGLSRLAVTVTITPIPTDPTGAASQTFCSTGSPNLTTLTVTSGGTGLVWYDAATLGNVLPDTTVLTATTYYVASSNGACESVGRLAITTTENCPIPGCFNVAFTSPYPAATFTPATCNGLVQNNIAADCWAGEYSNVNVTSGQNYVFGSSIPTDFITISSDGITALASGTGTATWVSNVTGVVRFYTHTTGCGTNTTNRTRYVTCGTVSSALPDYANLQFPSTITIAAGGSDVVYGQVYEAGLTDVAPNIVGQAPGIQAWVGISPVGSNTNPNTWTTWVPATWNSGHVSNNDEYQATIGATLAPGTYYYATRFNLDNGAYVYGGLNFGFWNAATNPSGVLTVTPPANDNFANATAVSCGNVYTGNTSSATLDEDNAPDGFGADLDASNLWYSFTGSGAAQTVTVNLCGSSYDTSVLVYTGTSGNLTLVAANDDDSTCISNTLNSKTSFVSDGTTTYYITVEGWNAGSVGAFTMNVTCAAVNPPAVPNQDCGTALTVLVNGIDNNSDNSFGTVSSTQPSCDQFGSIQDVWFSFVAPTSGSVTALLTPGSMTSLNYNLYSGACGALTPVGACRSNLTAANTQSYTGLTAGATYYIQVWSNSSEQGTFTLRLSDDGLGNSDFDNNSFSYYPNPVRNTLNLSYSQEISNVEVYNLLGQKVSAISINSNQVQVDMTNLPKAAYIVKVTANNQVKTIKVMKE